ncbi:MAG: sulfatase family protein [Planctomycetota bacterium]|jgi:choline-sulfatase
MSRPPNVLLIISDQHQRDATGCYGHQVVKTPNIDRLAARGVTFTNAYCQSPLCAPSRASLLTGTHVHTCGAWSGRAKKPIAELPTLSGLLREAGYATGSIGKVHIVGEEKDGRDLGFSERALRYYTHKKQDYIDAVGAEKAAKYAPSKADDPLRSDYMNRNNLPVELEDADIFDDLVVERSIRFMEDHRDEPFFLWAGLEKPHPNWYAPKRFHDMYDPAEMRLPESLKSRPEGFPLTSWKKLQEVESYSEEEIRGCIAAYYANVTYMDHSAGRLLEALERLGLAENTIVIYTTDHGELLFQHGMTQKHCFFEPSAAVPLILAGPGLPEGERREHIVSLLDLFPTLAPVCGITPPEALEGEDLKEVIAGSAPVEGREAFCEFYSFGYAERMIRTPEWKYVHSETWSPQLFNVKGDPLETENLAGRPEHADTCRELDARVTQGWELPDPEEIARPDLASLRDG